MSSFLFSASAVRYLKIIEKLKRAWVDPLRLPDYNHTWYTIACVFYFSLYAYQSDQENKSIFSTYITRYNSALRPLLAQTQTPERRPFLNTRGRTGSSAVTKLAVKFDIPSVNPAGPPHLYVFNDRLWLTRKSFFYSFYNFRTLYKFSSKSVYVVSNTSRCWTSSLIIIGSIV